MRTNEGQSEYAEGIPVWLARIVDQLMELRGELKECAELARADGEPFRKLFEEIGPELRERIAAIVGESDSGYRPPPPADIHEGLGAAMREQLAQGGRGAFRVPDVPLIVPPPVEDEEPDEDEESDAEADDENEGPPYPTPYAHLREERVREILANTVEDAARENALEELRQRGLTP